MCARYVLSSHAKQLEALFDVDIPEALPPRYNIAPTQAVLAIATREHVRRASFYIWGLIPSWSKDPSIGHRLVNARSESAAEKPAFRSAYRSRRCVIPATGFIEWPHRTIEEETASDLLREGQLSLDVFDEPIRERTRSGPKQPYLFTLPDAPVFGLAGLWEHWNSPSGTVETCTILTTEPNPLVGRLHNRMPCILDEAGIEAWLSDEPTSALTPFLAPFPADRMESYKIDPRINDPRNEGSDLVSRK